MPDQPSPSARPPALATVYPQLDRLARRQHGVVSLDQCRAHGMTWDQVKWRIRTGAMVPVRPQVYRWCGAVPSWRMMATAAVLVAGGDAALSHRSAAVLWGLLPASPPDRGFDSSHTLRLDITAPRSVRLSGVAGHRKALARHERTIRYGIAVTTAERTLVDLAGSCDADELGRLIDEALRRRLTTLTKLEVALRAHAGGGRRRTRPLRDALAERGARYTPGDNPGELAMDRLWDSLDLPPAVRQYRVRVGNRTYVLDRAIVELKIGIEWNGRDQHGLWSRFHQDSDRRNDLVAHGWLILDFTMKTDPRRIERTVRAAVEQRRLLLLPA